MPTIAMNNHRNRSATYPALQTFAVTPSDTDDLKVVCRRFFVGTGGDVSLVDTAGNTLVHKNVPSGSYIGDAYFSKVKQTGTSALDIIAYE